MAGDAGTATPRYGVFCYPGKRRPEGPAAGHPQQHRRFGHRRPRLRHRRRRDHHEGDAFGWMRPPGEEQPVSGDSMRGVLGVGCENPANAADTTRISVAVQLGDGTPNGGNYFEYFQLEQGVGARVLGCVSNFQASYNKFYHVDGGITCRQPAHQETNYFVITRNEFRELLTFGLRLRGQSIAVSDLSYNVFAGITLLNVQFLPPDALAAALWVKTFPRTRPSPRSPALRTISLRGTKSRFSTKATSRSRTLAPPISDAPTSATEVRTREATPSIAISAGSQDDPFVGGDIVIRGTKFPVSFLFVRLQRVGPRSADHRNDPDHRWHGLDRDQWDTGI